MTTPATIWGNLSQPPAVGPMPLPYEPLLRPPVTSFNAASFGAAGDGVTDDTAALLAAFSAACAAGVASEVFLAGLRGSTFLISSTLPITTPNVQVRGGGWDTQLLAAPGFGANPMLHAYDPGGNFLYGVSVKDVYFNAANVAGIIGLQFDSCYHALIDHVYVRYCPGVSIYMNGVSGKFGAYNTIRHCVITDGGGGVGVNTNYNEWLLIQGCQFVTFTTAGAYAIELTNLNCIVDGCMFDNCDTALYLSYSNRAVVSNCQFDRGLTRFINLRGNQGTSITGCVFNTRAGGGTECIYVNDGNNQSNVISGCSVEPGTTWPNFINEAGNVGAPSNLYIGNNTAGLPIALHNGIARSNAGYNPVGHLTAQPAVPATTVPYTNVSGVDCTVYLAGGTVTAVAVSGSATGLTSGMFRVPAGSTITLTYSAAPTWQWFGE